MGKLAELSRELLRHSPQLNFNAIEVGAMPIPGHPEPIHALLNLFKDSTLYAFEPDQEMCEQLNASSPANIRYIPKALGVSNTQATLYKTENRSCYSLYQPNEAFCGLYRGMESMKTIGTEAIDVYTMDSLLETGDIDDPDTIKIDVQGAELDIFKGANRSLESTLLIVAEVEFVPLYKEQPLFGDVAGYLREQGFMFHKFSGICGRNLAPVDLGQHINQGSQQMWSDAIFIRDLSELDRLSTEALLKLALFSIIYQSPDLCHFCLARVDERDNTSLAESFIRLLNA
ncbi:MAG: hypothetical protein C9356_09035 [Oleiphilus sp.]|nr:MAG: hypothetical protein C9356_09035 [Oleiphilus sp.]